MFPVVIPGVVALIMWTLRGPLQTSQSDKPADSSPLRAKKGKAITIFLDDKTKASVLYNWEDNEP
jgi:hypothetical protein